MSGFGGPVHIANPNGNPVNSNIVGSSGNVADVNSSGQLHTVLRGTQDIGNSTTDNLIADAVFTGTPIDSLDYASVCILIHSDQASATSGLVVQYSADGSTDWHDGEAYTLLANVDKFWTPTLQSKYMRIKYTNGGTGTSDFHIETVLRKQPIKWSSHNIDDPIKDQDDAVLVKSVITGKSPSGDFINVKTNPEGAMSSTDFLFEVSRGNVSGVNFVHKFGRNSDIDTGGFEAIWNGGGDYTGQNCTVAETLETFSSSANDSGTLVSSGTATGGSSTTLIDTGATFSSDGVAVGDILINDTLVDHGIVTAVTETQLTFLRMGSASVNVSGNAYRVATDASTGTAVVKLGFLLDGDFDNETEEYIILNGTTPVDTVGTYIRHSRGRCYINTNIGAITARQKTTTANITMVLPIGYNGTMICAYTIPAGKKGYIKKWFSSLAKKTNGFCNVRLMARAVNESFSVQEEYTITTTGSSYVERNYDVPKDSIREMTDLKVMADSSVNDMGVSAGMDIILTTE